MGVLHLPRVLSQDPKGIFMASSPDPSSVVLPSAHTVTHLVTSIPEVMLSCVVVVDPSYIVVSSGRFKEVRALSELERAGIL